MVETPLLDRAAIKGWPGMSTQKLAPLIGGKGRERTHESGYLSATLQGGHRIMAPLYCKYTLHTCCRSENCDVRISLKLLQISKRDFYWGFKEATSPSHFPPGFD